MEQSFGHVDTGSGMSAFKSMWKDPQKGESPFFSLSESVLKRLVPLVKPPVVEHPQTPALTAAKGNGLPPPRRNAPVAEVIAVEEEVITEGQVQALYDYNGSVRSLSRSSDGVLMRRTSQIYLYRRIRS